MIETSTLTNLTGADLAAGAQLIASQISPPNPSEFRFWWSTRYEDQLLRVFAAPWNIWIAVGPDRFEVPFRNDSGDTLRKGALVIPAGASAFSIATGPSINVIGFLQETTASGAFGPVASCGVGFVSAEVTTTAQSGKALSSRNAIAGSVMADGGDSSSNASGPIYAALIDDATGGGWTGVTEHGFRAILWGPKTQFGFG